VCQACGAELHATRCLLDECADHAFEFELRVALLKRGDERSIGFRKCGEKEGGEDLIWEFDLERKEVVDNVLELLDMLGNRSSFVQAKTEEACKRSSLNLVLELGLGQG
jgi:hypothetical protein